MDLFEIGFWAVAIAEVEFPATAEAAVGLLARVFEYEDQLDYVAALGRKVASIAGWSDSCRVVLRCPHHFC